VLRKIKKTEIYKYGFRRCETKHKAIMFPYLDEMWYTTKKLNRRYIDLPQ